MKVIFKKNHREGINAFQKGEIAVIHHTLGQKLLKKGVVEVTDIETEEDRVLKKLRDGNDGEN